jgi:nitrate reductase NapAB chaperone NapD
VLESADSRLIADVATELQNLQGVLTVSIVAHLTERASQLDQSNEPTPISAQ